VVIREYLRYRETGVAKEEKERIRAEMWIELANKNI
jgi:hypothetical protein